MTRDEDGSLSSMIQGYSDQALPERDELVPSRRSTRCCSVLRTTSVERPPGSETTNGRCRLDAVHLPLPQALLERGMVAQPIEPKEGIQILGNTRHNDPPRYMHL